MPATNDTTPPTRMTPPRATSPRAASVADIVAEMQQDSSHTLRVPTLIALGRSMEELGVPAAPQFARNEHGTIIGIVVRPATTGESV